MELELEFKSGFTFLIENSFPKSLKEQEMIIDKVDSIAEQSQKLKDIYQRKINDLEELKNLSYKSICRRIEN